MEEFTLNPATNARGRTCRKCVAERRRKKTQRKRELPWYLRDTSPKKKYPGRSRNPFVE